MAHARACTAALHVLQFWALLLALLTLLSPLLIFFYLVISLVFVPMIIIGLRSAADDEGLPEGFRLYKFPHAIVLVPVYLLLANV